MKMSTLKGHGAESSQAKNASGQTDHAQLLLQAAESLLAATTRDDILRITAEASTLLTGATRSMVVCDDLDLPSLHVVCCPSSSSMNGEIGECLCRVLASGAAGIVTRDALLRQSLFLPLVQQYPALTSLLALPLAGEQCRPAGLLLAMREAHGDFHAGDEEILNRLASLTSNALRCLQERREAEDCAVERDALFAVAPDPLFIITPYGVARENGAAIETFGASLVELLQGEADIAQAFIQRFDVRDFTDCPLKEDALPFARSLQGEAASHQALRFTTIDGRVIDADVSVAPIRHAGHVTGAAVMLRNVTAHRRRNEEQRRQQRVLDAVLETAPVGIAVLEGADHHFTLFNKAFARLMGISHQALGASIVELWPDRADHYLPILDSVCDTGEERRLEELPVWLPDDRDHQPSFVTFTYRPICSEKGVSAILMLVQDVTGQARARRCIEDTAGARDTDWNRLLAAIDVLPMPVVFLDTGEQSDHPPVWGNRAAEEFRQRHRLRDMCELPLLQANTGRLVSSKRQPLSRAALGQVVSGEEYVLALPDGRQMPVLYYASPIRDNGNIVAVMGVFQDISALKEADRAKDEFLAVLSHELQTPLTSILGWSDLALTRDADAAFQQQALQVVHRNARRQLELVRNMLDMSRILHRKLEMRQKLVDLGNVGSEAVAGMEEEARKLGIRLAFHCAERLPVVADPRVLQQAIRHLLQNSLHYTPEGGSVRVDCCRRGQKGLLIVQDTGRGIAPEVLPTLFKPFQQIDRDERVGGLGLGLALARGILEMLGGKIDVASPGLGKGSTFTITLPLVQHPAHRAATAVAD